MSGSPTHSIEAHSPTSSEAVPLSLSSPPSSSDPASAEVPLPSEPDVVKVKPAALATEQDAVSSSESSGSSRYADCLHV